MFTFQDNALQRWFPMDELDRFQREMMRAFSGSTGGYAGGSISRANLWVNETEGVLAVEAPGVKPEEIEVSVVDSTVTVQFKRDEDKLDSSESYIRRERRAGSVTRSFEMPFAVDAEKVQAKYENGVLQVKLPCAEAEKPTKIAVAVH